MKMAKTRYCSSRASLPSWRKVRAVTKAMTMCEKSLVYW
jgi:hypothetical protein